MKKVFVSHVKEYAGPGVVETLSRRGYEVFCHDRSFVDRVERDEYDRRDNVRTLISQTPKEIADELAAVGEFTRFVFNDVHPNTPKPFEDVSLEELRSAHAALFEFPFHLCQMVLPVLKKRQAGSVVFITSARQLQPEPGFSLATSIRAGTTALAVAVAREVAPFGVQVNAIQPNYLYSEMYYPKASFIDDQSGREIIARAVPAGRLGNPEEFGELVEFYISGRSPFTTGQIINFTGGWP